MTFYTKELLSQPIEDVIKIYLRIDEGEDDPVLALLISAAEDYLSEAGVPDDRKDTPKYKLAVLLLVALNYENRNPAMKIEKVSFSLESIIWQLKTG